MKNIAKKPVLGVLVLCAAIAFILLFKHNAPPPGQPVLARQGMLSIDTAAGKRDFNIEIAITPAEQAHGLMNRSSMPADHGMAFLWKEDGMRDMWMKDTLIPLDMLFIDHQGSIVHIASNATPNSFDVISAGRPTQAVIELVGGTAAAQNIKVGDRIHIQLPAQ